MQTWKHWIAATRPKTLPFGLSPAIVGSAYSAHLGKFSWTIFFLALGVALFLQIGANYANDLFDWEQGADNKARIGPVRAVASGVITPRQMRWGIALSFAGALFCALPILWQGGWWLTALFCITVCAALAYSSGPFPLAYHGLGEVANLLFMAMLPTWAMTYAHSKEMHLGALGLGLSFGGLTSAVMCINNLRDEESDKKARKWTLVARFGNTFGKRWLLFLLLYPLLLPWVLYAYCDLPITICGTSLLIIPTIPLIKLLKQSLHSHDYFPLFSKTAILAFVYALTLVYGLLL